MTPKFFDESKIGTVFPPDLLGAALEGSRYAAANNIKSYFEDKRNVILCIIDPQMDFVNPPGSNYPGSLYVKNAEHDMNRLCRFIFNNVDKINNIVCSLDTHFLFQPFHPLNWVAGSQPSSDRNGVPYQPGEYPKPYTLISLKDVHKDVWRAARHPARMMEMLEKLENEQKKQLCIWPVHCELGSVGHAMESMLFHTIHWHAGARKSQYGLTEKGMSPWAEHYGILQAEVEFKDDDRTHLNIEMLNKWAQADAIYFAGEARTHCVLETLRQVQKYFAKTSPEVIKRLFVLEDCMSDVPDIVDTNTGQIIAPFGQWADDGFAELKKMGFNFVKSTAGVTV